jgi:hypothetical protein
MVKTGGICTKPKSDSDSLSKSRSDPDMRDMREQFMHHFQSLDDLNNLDDPPVFEQNTKFWIQEKITEYNTEVFNIEQMGLVNFNTHTRFHNYGQLLEEYLYKYYGEQMTHERLMYLREYLME